MKKPIEIGERVSAEWEGGEEVMRITGTYEETDKFGFARICAVNGDDRVTYCCVPKSMRRIVKKKCEEIWVVRRADTLRCFTYKEAAEQNIKSLPYVAMKPVEIIRYVKAKKQD